MCDTDTELNIWRISQACRALAVTGGRHVLVVEVIYFVGNVITFLMRFAF